MRFMFLPICLVACLIFLGAGALSFSSQLVLLAGLVACLGLPHGALDPFVAHQRGHWQTSPGFARFIAIYLGISASVFLFWAWMPIIALPGFLLVSAWHFGEDWSCDTKSLPSEQRWLFGLAIVSLPSLAHGPEVADLYGLLTDLDMSWLAQLQGWVALLCVLSLLVFTQADVGSSSALRLRWAELFALTISAVILPPLLFFIVYFCCLHSPKHFTAIMSGLTWQQTKAALVCCLVFSLGALALGGLLYFTAFDKLEASEAAMRLIFIGLAALTIPHIVLLDGLAEQTKALKVAFWERVNTRSAAA